MKISFAAAALLLATTNAAENATLPRGSPGCGKVVKEIGRIKQVSQFKVDGADRGFRTYTPKTYDKDTPQPLILAFHGHGKTQPSFARNSRFSLPTINPNMMVQYMMAGGVRTCIFPGLDHSPAPPACTDTTAAESLVWPPQLHQKVRG